MNSLDSRDGVENPVPAETADASAGWQATAQRYFLRTLMIGAGVFLGAILALVIGLFTGWIEISC